MPAAVLGMLWILAPGICAAQQPVAPAKEVGPQAAADPAAQVDAPDAAGDPLDDENPTSTEDGQKPLDESFGTRTRAEWIRETRRKALEDTKFDVQLRSYDFDRDKYDGSESEAWAVGGSAGLKTGYFRERLAIGATGYTSQELRGPEDKDGTLLLKPGQEGYTVLGEIYGEFLINEGTRLSAGRRLLDTPYIGRDDVRMTPNTFEMIALQGLYGGDGQAEWRGGLGYVDEIKSINADEFVSMAEDAGAPAGIDRGVYVAGANYRKGDFSIGAVDYYSDDIINIFYTELKYALPLSETLRLQLAMQYTDQQSTGDDLLFGSDFSAHQWGGKAEIAAGGALFTTAYTSNGGDTDIQKPWSTHPGYTAIQMESFVRDGEDAWMLRAAYNFKSVKGLSVYGLWVDGSDPDDPGQFARDEYNLNLQWAVASGPLKGLMVRLRYGHASQDDPADSEQDDVRVMIFYDPPAL